MVSLLDEIDNLPRDDIFALYDMIREKMPNLMSRLSEDVILNIMSFLTLPEDRIAFIQALHEKQSRRGAHAHLSHSFGSQLAFDIACLNLRSNLYMLADVVHYLVPSCFGLRSLVFADWSVFGNLSTPEIAVIYWSDVPPHARIDVNYSVLNHHVRSMLFRGSGYVRLSAHVVHEHEEQRQTRQQIVRLKNRRVKTYVLKESVQSSFVHLLPTLGWINPQMLVFRHEICAGIRGAIF